MNVGGIRSKIYDDLQAGNLKNIDKSDRYKYIGMQLVGRFLHVFNVLPSKQLKQPHKKKNKKKPLRALKNSRVSLSFLFLASQEIEIGFVSFFFTIFLYKLAYHPHISCPIFGI